jgi:hypothetical protein
MKLALTLAFCGVQLFGATTTTWELNTYQDFIKGRFQGIALDRDGRLSLAPKLQDVFDSGQPVIWSVAQAPDGSIYAGTGHRGRLYKMSPGGTTALVWSSDQPEIFAVAVDAKGIVYAATSPDGKVYRIDQGKAVEVYAPAAKYIWSLTTAKDGALYIGTGEPGNVYRVDPNGAGELYYETGQSNITSLAMDSKGLVLAGSEPNGILYRISAKDKAFVLYDANLPEIRSIVPMPDGTIYAAALGGSVASRTGQLANLPASIGAVTVTAPATSITVTDSPAQSGPDIKPKASAATAAASSTNAVVSQAGPVVEIAGVDKSALYKINPDSTVETLWSSKDENVYDLVAHSNGDLYFTTDAQGRIYRLNADQKPAMIVQTTEGEATRLIESRNGLLAATGDMGKLFRLEDAQTPTGTYESPVHDANTVARWGRIGWHGRTGKVAIETRTGNSARPDKTWSDWSAAMTDPDHSLIQSPNARYIQWRAELSGDQPVLENVTVAYLPQNTPPVIRSINVTTQAAATAAKSNAGSASSSAAYTITVTDTGEASSSAGTPTQTLSRSSGSQIQISWQAEDADGDRLVYAVYFRGEDQTQWMMLRGNMFENSLLLDGDILADGRYYFRVTASDRPSNARDAARETELVSSPVLIDNTPPTVTFGTPQRREGHFEVTINAEDRTSSLRRCEYSVDASSWLPVEAMDGVTDSPKEQFQIVLDRLRPGEHLLVVRVYDTAGNPGLAKLLIR